MTDTHSSQPRGGNGKFIRTTHSAERDAEAARLRDTGLGYKEIAAQLGYADKGMAWRGVQRALADIVREPAEKLRATEAAKLDELYVEALEVLAGEHYLVSYGEVMKDADDEPLADPGPRLQAIDKLLKIRESYRRLHGLDAATKTEVSAGVRYELVGIDPEELK